MSASAASSEPRPPAAGRLPQPLVLRITHWANLVLLVILAGSGLQIFNAFPSLGPRDDLYGWYPFQEVDMPQWLTLGGWLGGARHLHFAFAWLLVLNGALYLVYVVATGEARRRYFWPPRDAGNAVQMALFYARLRKTEPPTGFYNGLQRGAYTGILAVGAFQVLSGLAIYKPVQLAWLTALLGGYDTARTLHFLSLAALIFMVFGHVVMVALHPKTFVAMVTGGRRG